MCKDFLYNLTVIIW